MITNKKQQQWIAYYSICNSVWKFFARCGRCNALNAAHNVGFNTFYWVGPLYDRAHPHSVLGGPGLPRPPPPGSTPLIPGVKPTVNYSSTVLSNEHFCLDVLSYTTAEVQYSLPVEQQCLDGLRIDYTALDRISCASMHRIVTPREINDAKRPEIS
jgi:hypothetical protein